MALTLYKRKRAARLYSDHPFPVFAIPSRGEPEETYIIAF